MTLASSLAQDPNSEGHFIGSLTNGTRICDGWRIRKGFHPNLSRKHQVEGAWKVTLQNLLFLILFKCGANPERLHRWYYSKELKMRERAETMSSRGQPDHGLQSDI